MLRFLLECFKRIKLSIGYAKTLCHEMSPSGYTNHHVLIFVLFVLNLVSCNDIFDILYCCMIIMSIVSETFKVIAFDNNVNNNVKEYVKTPIYENFCIEICYVRGISSMILNIRYAYTSFLFRFRKKFRKLLARVKFYFKFIL